jgi:tellurite resistance protein TerC
MEMSSLLNTAILGHAAWLWLTFAAIVVVLLAIDLGVLNKKDHVITLRESLLAWISTAR